MKHHYLKVFHQQNQRICLPIRNLSQFIIFGNISLPKQVIQIAYSHQIPVLYLKSSPAIAQTVCWRFLFYL